MLSLSAGKSMSFSAAATERVSCSFILSPCGSPGLRPDEVVEAHAGLGQRLLQRLASGGYGLLRPPPVPGRPAVARVLVRTHAGVRTRPFLLFSGDRQKNGDFSPKIRPGTAFRAYRFRQPHTSTPRQVLLLSETCVRCQPAQERDAMTRLRSARTSRMRYVWPLGEDARTVRHARTIIRDELSALGLSPDLVDDAVLMVSELVTNALMYGEAPYELGLHVDAREIMCAVVDGSPLLPEPAEPDTTAEHGRGLRIVARLSDGFHGCHPQRYVTHPHLVGKATWFALPRQGPAGNVVPIRSGV
ncbi:hypothetical protein C1J01_05765 [Nonomuraea aridisoli]|uniref:Histidine kinase/HSP90-like ATPase domain-containing protein n=2 Tax=Nonomuraea aridisoli TaxID=2070368 RepID=A0A2W2G4E6_9ACTN|nr:hypothetical protein C1J01_05765 [Nonomuraea aridisoli]